MLAAAWRLYPDALRADLQRYYGIDIDHAMAGAHSAGHIAALAAHLPPDSALHVANDPDAIWTYEMVILADIRNSLVGLIYGMSDKKRRGKKPQLIGPSWMTRGAMRSLEARVLPIDELMAELNKPRIPKGVRR